MSILIIVFCAWFLSMMIRSAKETKRKRAEEQRSADLKRMTAEWKQRQAEAKLETERLIALEREQMRQAKEQEKLEKEQKRQAEVLAKHEERLLRLEQKLELAQRDEEHYSEEVTAITIDMKSVKGYVDYMKGRGLPCKGKEAELEKLNKKLYAAETKLIKARQARELCEKQMSA